MRDASTGETFRERHTRMRTRRVHTETLVTLFPVLRSPELITAAAFTCSQ